MAGAILDKSRRKHKRLVDISGTGRECLRRVT
jgi:hypothetical protein